jgi:hypothetical protein
MKNQWLASLFVAAFCSIVSGCGGADGSEAEMVSGGSVENQAAQVTATEQESQSVKEQDQKQATPGSPAESEQQTFECGPCAFGLRYCCWCNPIQGCYSCGTYSC